LTATTTTPESPLRQRVHRIRRLASVGLRRSELSMDSQIGLRDIRSAVRAQIEAARTEHVRDRVTDRQRVGKYRAIATAIAGCDPNVGRAALVSLASFEFADEYLEDQHRDGEIAAGERLEQNIADLHDALHELTPALVTGVARPS